MNDFTSMQVHKQNKTWGLSDVMIIVLTYSKTCISSFKLLNFRKHDIESHERVTHQYSIVL